jgi:hypothetical protein
MGAGMSLAKIAKIAKIVKKNSEIYNLEFALRPWRSWREYF